MEDFIKIMTLNIGNPSLERARKQISWIENREEDVFILTETKNSDGCNYIEEYFSGYGLDLFTIDSEKKYYVYFPKSKTGDLGVMIISKIPFEDTYTVFTSDNVFYTRFAGCILKHKEFCFRLIGLYVPSRDRSDEKIARKKKFCIETANYIKSEKDMPCIICGDLNILNRSHIPHYSTFFDWEYNFYDFFYKEGYTDAFIHCYPYENEYSWVGRTNDGYRYDYCFVSDDVSKNIIDCQYLHTTRRINITDHSAVTLTINV
jgi:exodeoxyribonuclease-3